ncbi:MAG: glutaredoxin family protein [Methanomassiliicoccales archaeon]|nr:MAG: glutaredoxin family protein [Methanomassiliicoccales archaeon]
MQKVPGKKKDHKVVAFTISTCGWCNKMKKLLQDMEVEYEYANIDLLSGEELEQVREELRKYNPRMSAPTLVVDDGKEVIIGFKEDEVRRCLGNEE